jgi:hypothetical protein
MKITPGEFDDTPGKPEDSEKEAKPGFWWNVGIIALRLVLNVIGTLYQSWVLQALWGWFIVGSFGLPALTLVGALGIMIVGYYVSLRSSDAKLDIFLKDKIPSGMANALSWCGPFLTGTVGLLLGAMWHYIVLPILGLG